MQRRRLLAFTGIALLALIASAPAQVVAADGPIGHWEGAITLPGSKLEIRIDLSADGDGHKGTIDIPVQGLRGFKLADVNVDAQAVSFKLPGIPGNPTFDGELDAAGDTISGTFAQAGNDLPFEIKRAEAKPAAGETPSKGVPGEGLAGVWQGSLRVQVFELRLLVRINEDDGKLTGEMDSLDQGVTGVPLSKAELNGDDVTLEVKEIGGTFKGKISDDGSELDGKWKQGGQTMDLVLRRLAEEPDLRRPQEPQPPFPYSSNDITFPNKDAGIELAGTLTVPDGDGPHPAIVLVSGSGPQDRDETLMGHKPFRVLADYLTRRGIAVLRYDDRGVADSGGDFAKATVSDFTSDTLAAVAHLKALKTIDSDRIGIAGHSEGGLIAPSAAVQSDDISMIILMAGPGVPLRDLLATQARDVLTGMGVTGEPRERQLTVQKELLDLIVANVGNEDLEQMVRDHFKGLEDRFTEEQLTQLGYEESAIEAQIKTLLMPWFQQFLLIDPAKDLRRVTCPVLAINGQKDIQVASQDNLRAIEQALLAGGNDDITIVEFPNLNHLFQTCKTGAVSEYSSIEETFNEEVMKRIADWVLAR